MTEYDVLKMKLVTERTLAKERLEAKEALREHLADKTHENEKMKEMNFLLKQELRALQRLNSLRGKRSVTKLIGKARRSINGDLVIRTYFTNGDICERLAALAAQKETVYNDVMAFNENNEDSMLPSEIAAQAQA